eukprot:comp21012_c0_seq5/m.44038 comp21012_c0_seq5/g.44038  ORF comp21012_c0_seq5/g.44038 comp21012_c0_seq5/m.44038 type:complete len:414 (-) comp21012_c0_seq5:1165-2406(-)
MLTQCISWIVDPPKSPTLSRVIATVMTPGFGRRSMSTIEAGFSARPEAYRPEPRLRSLDDRMASSAIEYFSSSMLCSESAILMNDGIVSAHISRSSSSWNTRPVRSSGSSAILVTRKRTEVSEVCTRKMGEFRYSNELLRLGSITRKRLTLASGSCTHSAKSPSRLVSLPLSLPSLVIWIFSVLRQRNTGGSCGCHPGFPTFSVSLYTTVFMLPMSWPRSTLKRVSWMCVNTKSAFESGPDVVVDPAASSDDETGPPRLGAPTVLAAPRASPDEPCLRRRSMPPCVRLLGSSTSTLSIQISLAMKISSACGRLTLSSRFIRFTNAITALLLSVGATPPNPSSNNSSSSETRAIRQCVSEPACGWSTARDAWSSVSTRPLYENAWPASTVCMHRMLPSCSLIATSDTGSHVNVS